MPKSSPPFWRREPRSTPLNPEGDPLLRGMEEAGRSFLPEIMEGDGAAAALISPFDPRCDRDENRWRYFAMRDAFRRRRYATVRMCGRWERPDSEWSPGTPNSSSARARPRREWFLRVCAERFRDVLTPIQETAASEEEFRGDVSRLAEAFGETGFLMQLEDGTWRGFGRRPSAGEGEEGDASCWKALPGPTSLSDLPAAWESLHANREWPGAESGATRFVIEAAIPLPSGRRLIGRLRRLLDLQTSGGERVPMLDRMTAADLDRRERWLRRDPYLKKVMLTNPFDRLRTRARRIRKYVLRQGFETRIVRGEEELDWLVAETAAPFLIVSPGAGTQRTESARRDVVEAFHHESLQGTWAFLDLTGRWRSSAKRRSRREWFFCVWSRRNAGSGERFAPGELATDEELDQELDSWLPDLGDSGIIRRFGNGRIGLFRIEDGRLIRVAEKDGANLSGERLFGWWETVSRGAAAWSDLGAPEDLRFDFDSAIAPLERLMPAVYQVPDRRSQIAGTPVGEEPAEGRRVSVNFGGFEFEATEEPGPDRSS